MKVFAGIAFVGIIIAGIVFTILASEDSGLIGFLIFIGSIIAAFLAVAMQMIFLNLAQDVSEIKQLLKNKRL